MQNRVENSPHQTCIPGMPPLGEYVSFITNVYQQTDNEQSSNPITGAESRACTLKDKLDAWWTLKEVVILGVIYCACYTENTH